MRSGVPIIDLFAGAGGIGIGAVMGGGDLRLSVELDEKCCDTLRQNSEDHPGEVLCADVSSLNGRELRKLAGLGAKDPLIVVGGPPCQPFSKAAYWTDPGEDARYRRARSQGQEASRPDPITKAKPDERRTLVEEFLARIIEASADGFVFENVVSITHPRNRPLLTAFINCANEAGYETTVLKANAAEFGVPQIRERVFVLGSKWGRPTAPSPTHTIEGNPNLFLRRAVTSGEAIGEFDLHSFFEPEEVVTGKWEEQFREIPPGWNYKALSAWAGHPKPVFEAETRFWNFLLKLSPDKPSWTLAASPGPWTGPFHWNNRRLRTVEMAVLQSFPNHYKFSGSRRDRVRQIGNAAPALLVKHMVAAVIEALSSKAFKPSGTSGFA